MKYTTWLMVSGLYLGLAQAASGADGLSVGDPAPEFSLAGSDGKMYTLAEFKGKKPVVIAWFPKAFTGGCTAECKSMRDNGAALRELNIAYFTASCDDAETNKRFAESLQLDYPILSDPTRETAKAYGVIIGDRPNAARWTFYIDIEGKIRHIDKQVKTRQHGEDVAAQLKELELQGK